MPIYQYKARGEEGRLISGKMNASSEMDLQNRLEGNGFYLISYSRDRKNILNEDIIGNLLPISLRSLYTLTLQLANTVETGVPLLVSLRSISDGCKNKKLLTILKTVMEDLGSGSSFSEALYKHPSLFSKFYVSTVELGETSGALPKILYGLAEYIKKEIETRRRIASALAYPAILTLVGTGITVYVLTNIIPGFVTLFSESKVALPLPTAILLNTSKFLTKFWHFCLLAPIAVAMGYRLIVLTEAGKIAVDKIKLRIPIVGEVEKKICAKKFIDSLNLLYTSGLPILSALNIVRSMLGNRYLEKIIDALWIHISRGKDLASYLAMTDFLPPDILAMVRSGEESGTLGKMLDKASNIYQEEVNYAIEGLISAFEIGVILVIGAGVGFIAVAILFPIMRLSQTLAIR